MKQKMINWIFVWCFCAAIVTVYAIYMQFGAIDRMTSYLDRSITERTERADIKETACSPDLPP